jgi:hypothetical protein
MGKAKFGITLEAPTVEAGSHLKGVVFCDVEQEITGTQMTLTFSGMEQTNVRYLERTGSGNTERLETRTAVGSRNLIQVHFPINGSDMILTGNCIAPGHYKLPFELELPSSLPSTMTQSWNGGSCQIKYNLQAVLKGSGSLLNYQCDRDVVVRAKAMDTEPIPYNHEPYTESVSLLCCLSRGAIAFGAMVDDTRLHRGETTSINMSW